MTKVLYIAAWGRSGTTILDNILNSYQSVFSAGELYFLWSRGLAEGRKCGCGVRLADCPLWSEILRVAYGDNPPAPGHVHALQRRIVRVRNTPKLLRSQLDPDAEEYRQILGRLYPAIAKVTGAELIVDSSKVPSAAAILARVDEVEPYLLHMVRDPRAVAHSWMRVTPQLDRARPATMQRHSATESTMNWLAWNGLIERVAQLYPDRHRRLRYEDFVASPRGTVEDLLNFASVSADGGPFQDDHTVCLQQNHTVSGNPGRFRTGEIALRPDDRWRAQQDMRPRLVSTALSLPLLHRYRYRLVPRRRISPPAGQ